MNLRKGTGILKFKMLLRYLIVFFSGFSNLYFYYLVFAPLTVNLIYFFLKTMEIFGFKVFLSGNTLFLKNYSIEIIDACIGGSAYFLLFFLNLSVPMKLKKRMKSLMFSFSAFLFFNVFRILILIAFLIFLGENFFNEAHKIMWYSLNIPAVAFIWFIGVRIFKIKEIPVYSDLRALLRK